MPIENTTADLQAATRVQVRNQLAQAEASKAQQPVIKANLAKLVANPNVVAAFASNASEFAEITAAVAAL